LNADGTFPNWRWRSRSVAIWAASSRWDFASAARACLAEAAFFAIFAQVARWIASWRAV
jgi:hypothetical protein